MQSRRIGAQGAHAFAGLRRRGQFFRRRQAHRVHLDPQRQPESVRDGRGRIARAPTRRINRATTAARSSLPTTVGSSFAAIAKRKTCCNSMRSPPTGSTKSNSPRISIRSTGPPISIRAASTSYRRWPITRTVRGRRRTICTRWISITTTRTLAAEPSADHGQKRGRHPARLQPRRKKVDVDLDARPTDEPALDRRLASRYEGFS